jgi:hypothetical protein
MKNAHKTNKIYVQEWINFAGNSFYHNFVEIDLLLFKIEHH